MKRLKRNLVYVTLLLILIIGQQSALAMSNFKKNPWGCVTKVDNPHKSTTNNFQITGKASIKCSRVIARLMVQTTLFREGALGDWPQVGTVGAKTSFSRSKANNNRNPAVAKCFDDNYLNSGYFEVDNGGTKYMGNDGNFGPVDNCP